LAALACFLPETAVKRPGVLSAMLPTVAVPQHAWKALLLVAPIDVAAWALGGFYFSLGPTLIGKVTGMHSPAVGGVLIFVLTVSAAVSVLLLRAWAPQRMLISGIVALIAGVGTTLLAIDSGNAVLFFLGTIVAGFGFGVGFLGALRTLLPLAQPHERAGLMAAYYILSYLAFCLPAILAGIMVSHFGLIVASNYYGVALMALGGAALVGVKLFPVDG